MNSNSNEPLGKKQRAAILMSSTLTSAAVITGLIAATFLTMWWFDGGDDRNEAVPWLAIAGILYFELFVVLQAVVLFVHARYRAIAPAPLMIEALRAIGVYAAMAIVTIICILIFDERKRVSDMVIVFATLVAAAVPASFLSVAIYNRQARRSTIDEQS